MSNLLPPFTEQDIKIIRDNFALKTSTHIIEMLSVKMKNVTFMARCKRMGLKRDFRPPTSGTYNLSYFKDLNFNTCYFAGHIAADGCISVRGNKHYFSVLACEKDECIIDNYIRELKYKGKKADCYRKSPNSENIGKYYSIQLTCFNENAKYLKEYFNLEPKKTARLGPINVTNKYLSFAFLCGLIDGDGSIYGTKSGGKYKTIRIGCVSCSKPIIDWMKNLIDDNFSLVFQNKNAEVRKTRTIWRYSIGGLRAAIIINYLRKFPLAHLRLARKWDNPEVLAFIEEKKKLHPELFVEPNQDELALLMPPPKSPENTPEVISETAPEVETEAIPETSLVAA